MGSAKSARLQRQKDRTPMTRIRLRKAWAIRFYRHGKVEEVYLRKGSEIWVPESWAESVCAGICSHCQQPVTGNEALWEAICAHCGRAGVLAHNLAERVGSEVG